MTLYFQYLSKFDTHVSMSFEVVRIVCVTWTTFEAIKAILSAHLFFPGGSLSKFLWDNMGEKFGIDWQDSFS